MPKTSPPPRHSSSKQQKKPTQEEIGKKLMEKLRARKDDFKKAYESDCVDAYGKDKAQECQCYIGKTDFD